MNPPAAGGPVPDLVLTNPHAVVAALPHLLGFQPHECVVMLWVRAGRLILTQRLDLPGPEVDLGEFPHLLEWVDAAWLPAPSGTAEEVVIVFVSERLDLSALVDLLLARAQASDTEPRDVLRVDGELWWSLLCGDLACCPAQGRLVDEEIGAKVRAAFAVSGGAPYASREDLLSEFVGERRVQQAASRAWSRRDFMKGDPEDWRDACIDLICSCPREPSPGELAQAIMGVHDLPVRDTVLWDMQMMSTAELVATGEFLRACVRATTKRGQLRGAPIATLAGIASWLVGDGVRAVTAIDIALECDPEYSLAGLIMTALRAGVPPEKWRNTVSELTREDCRRPPGAGSGSG